MAMTTLRRKVIIREYDFEKIKKQALGIRTGDSPLYDRASFVPLNQETLEQLKLIDVLKGKKSPISTVDSKLQNPAKTVYHLRDYLYDERYNDWNISTDHEGYVTVQSRINTPKSRLGWGVFEKDLTSRV